ncbi:MAG: hypothetical protein R6V58_10445 [Planctomycetota bacterium]
MKKAVVYSIIIFWAIMMGFFVRREVIPYAFAQPYSGYGSLRAYARLHPSSQMLIYDGTPSQKLIGATDTAYILKADGTCEVSTRTVIDFRRHSQFASTSPARRLVATMIPKFTLQSELEISPQDTLRSFYIRTRSRQLQTTARGVVEEGSLHISAALNNEHFERPKHFDKSIPINREDILAHNFMPIGAIGGLRVGQTWRFRMIDPLSFQMSTAYAMVTGKKTVRIGGAWYKVFVVEFPRQVGSVKAYVSESNVLLRQTVEAWGLSLEFIRAPLPHQTDAEPPEDLLKQFLSPDQADD